MHRFVRTAVVCAWAAIFVAACVRAPSKHRPVGSVDLGVAISVLTGDGTDVDQVTVTVTSNDDMALPPVVQNLSNTVDGWTGVIGDLPAGYDHFDVVASEMGTEEYAGSTDTTILENQTIVVMILLQQYSPNAAFTNPAPAITAITATSNAVAPGDTVNLSVMANPGSMSDTLSFTWSDGYNAMDFSSTLSETPTWTAPMMPGPYTLTITVTNQLNASVTASLVISDESYNAAGSGNIEIQFNAWPVITEIYATPQNVVPSDMTTLTLVATSPSGDMLSNMWSDDCGGTFEFDGGNFWFAPVSPPMSGICTLSVTVTDTYGGYSNGFTTVLVGPALSTDVPPVIVSASQDVPQAALTDTINFSFAASDPQAGGTLSFVWNASAGLTLNGQTDGSGTSINSATVNAYAATYTVTVTATDSLTSMSTTQSYTVNGLALDSIIVNAEYGLYSLAIGVTEASSASGLFADGNARDISSLVEWSSSGSGALTVDGSGNVTALSVGSDTIYANYCSVQGSADFTATAFAVPNGTAGGPITYTRNPWGSIATSGTPAFSVVGAAGSADPLTTMNVFDGADPAKATLLGSTAVNSDGSFSSIALSPATDRQFVYLVETSAGGMNVGGSSIPQNVTWIATYQGKTPGNTTTNPNIIVDDPAANYTAGSYLPLFVQPPAETEVTSYPPPTTYFSESWVTQYASQTPAGRGASGTSFDSARGVAVMWGGYNGASEYTDTWEWNGSTWAQNVSAGGPSARTGEAMTYDAARGVTVLFGGSAVALYGPFYSDTWEYDGTVWTQLSPATSPPARGLGSMVYDPARGVSVLFGGCDDSLFCNSPLNDTWTWDGTTWTQLFPATSPPPRGSSPLVYDSAHGVSVLFGGLVSSSDLGDTWTWDGGNWTQQCPGTSPPARDSQGMVYDWPRGVTLLFGGQFWGNGSSLGDTWEWNGSNWNQLSPANSPAARFSPTMVFDSVNASTMLFSGYPDGLSGQFATDDTWYWNGTTWAPAAGSPPPGPADSGGMSYDSGRGVTVLWGAGGSDTWEFDGTAWNEIASASSPNTTPFALIRVSIAYDSLHGVTVLFGGEDGSSNLRNETWTYNGTSWTQASPMNSPPARVWGGMAFDSNHGYMVLYGGADNSGDLDDTWTYDGTNWTQNMTAGTGPGQISSFGMSYDIGNQATVLFGGYDPGICDTVNNTWTYDGNTWTQQFPITSPPTRATDAMAYDSVRGQTIVFGGGNNVGGLNDAWAWNGTTWTQLATNTEALPQTSVGMAYDSLHQETVLFAYDISGSFSDTFLLPSGVGDYPSDVAGIDFAATGETATTVALQNISIASNAGGTGYNTPAPPALGSSVSNSELGIWSTANSAGWVFVNGNSADSSAPAPLNYSTYTPAEAQEYLVGGEYNSIYVSFGPDFSTGNGPSPGGISVNGIEVTVNYQRLGSDDSCNYDFAGPCAADSNCVWNGIECLPGP